MQYQDKDFVFVLSIEVRKRLQSRLLKVRITLASVFFENPLGCFATSAQRNFSVSIAYHNFAVGKIGQCQASLA